MEDKLCSCATLDEKVTQITRPLNISANRLKIKSTTPQQVFSPRSNLSNVSAAAFSEQQSSNFELESTKFFGKHTKSKTPKADTKIQHYPEFIAQLNNILRFDLDDRGKSCKEDYGKPAKEKSLFDASSVVSVIGPSLICRLGQPIKSSRLVGQQLLKHKKVEEQEPKPIVMPEVTPPSDIDLRNLKSQLDKPKEEPDFELEQHFQLQCMPSSEHVDWTTNIVSKIDPHTARWMVEHHTKSPELKNKITKLLDNYGDSDNQSAKFGLVKDTLSFDYIKPKAPEFQSTEKSWTSDQTRHLEEALKLEDKYGDLPISARSEFKKKFDAHDVDQSAELTSDQEKQETSGKQPEKQKPKVKFTVMKKQLQEVYPKLPTEWSGQSQGKDTTKVQKGFRRWTGLPLEVEEMLISFKETDALAHWQTMLEGSTGERREGEDTKLEISKRHRSNTFLLSVVDDWRRQWKLDVCWRNMTMNELLKDMGDINPYVRLRAVASCSKAAQSGKIPEKLIVGMECLLNDDDTHVRKAAAITLYSLKRVKPTAEEILRHMLSQGTEVDRWHAAQCLADSGAYDHPVLTELIANLVESSDPVILGRAMMLLVKLSKSNELVISCVAEQLNSSSWKHRVAACKIFPQLNTKITKNISEKLSSLMWCDWNSQVRLAAAQALGKTGHGRLVHDNLVQLLETGDELTRVDVLQKIGSLGVMTARLLPVFLETLRDQFVSVRVEACITSGQLAQQNQHILKELVDLAMYDDSWKVKAHALRALGQISSHSPEIRECLLWAMRFEDDPSVRAEACHSIMQLGYQDPEIVGALHHQNLHDTNPAVRKEIAECLKLLEREGVKKSEAAVEGLLDIESELKRLCNPDRVLELIHAQEKGMVPNRYIVQQTIKPASPLLESLRESFTSSLSSSLV